MNKQHIIMYLSNKATEEIVNNFEKIRNNTQGRADCCYLYHNMSNEIPDILNNKLYYCFTDQIFETLPYISLKERSIIPGCDHFPFLQFYLDNPDYDYYWSVEDDVRFTGDWSVLLEAFADNNADFIGGYIDTYDASPEWGWWNSLKHVSGKMIPLNERLKSFNPIRRLSNRAMATLHQYMSDGWYGHQEVLMPTIFQREGYKIVDMGGKGPFVPEGFEYRFYNNESHSYLPVALGNKPNFIYHAIKELKRPEKYDYSRNCVISAVGGSSLHKEWINGTTDFDLHLLIYDDSYSYFYNDSPFIMCQKGYKLKLVYDYLQRNPDFLEIYDYFFLPDDDIRMSTEQVNALFREMRQNNLAIAQPGLIDSYYTYEHTLRHSKTTIRYVNFVEMMLPCFSTVALQKVLFTFNENKQGWGCEFHWPHLINFTGKEMAIFDRVNAVHTRPFQSGSIENHMDAKNYLKKYDLKMHIYESDARVIGNQKDRTLYISKNKYLNQILNQQLEKIYSPAFSTDCIELSTLSLLCQLYYRMSEKRKFNDISDNLIEHISSKLPLIKENLSFTDGLTGFAWFVEYMAQSELIDNNTDDVLDELNAILYLIDIDSWSDFSIKSGLSGIACYFQKRMLNRNYNLEQPEHLQEKIILDKILIRIAEYMKQQIESCFHDPNTTFMDCLYVLICLCENELTQTQHLILLNRTVDHLLKYDQKRTDYSFYLLVRALILLNRSNEIIDLISLYQHDERTEESGWDEIVQFHFNNQLYQKTSHDFFEQRSSTILNKWLSTEKLDNDLLTFNENTLKGLCILSTVGNLATDWEILLLCNN